MASATSAAKKADTEKKPAQTFLQRLPLFLTYVAVCYGIVLYTDKWSMKTTPNDPLKIYLLAPHSAPIIASIAYVFFVKVLGPIYITHFFPTQWAITKKFWGFVMIAWNLFLVILSGACFIGLTRHFVRVTLANPPQSLADVFCNEAHFHKDGWFWLTVFILSKFPELFDSVLIIARGRHPDFLHWFHHFTVLAYCWYSGMYFSSIGIFFASINSFVHFIMYDYYFAQGLGQRLSYAKRVTQIQIIQMVLGITVSVFFYLEHKKNPQRCTLTPAETTGNILIGTVLMYGSYLVLFLQYYIRRYFSASSRHAKTE